MAKLIREEDVCDINDGTEHAGTVETYTLTTPTKVKILDMCEGHAEPIEYLSGFGDVRPRETTRRRAAPETHSVIPVD